MAFVHRTNFFQIHNEQKQKQKQKSVLICFDWIEGPHLFWKLRETEKQDKSKAETI